MRVAYSTLSKVLNLCYSSQQRQANIKTSAVPQTLHAILRRITFIGADMHKYIVERIEESGSLPYWLVRHVFYRRETRVTKTIAKVYQPSFAVKIAAALNTLERRKTVRRKPPVQQRKGEICPECGGNGISNWNKCSHCGGASKLSPC